MENDQKRLSKKRFGEFAENYVKSATHAKGDDLKLLVQMANPRPDWKVLDVATGGGHTALAFSPLVAHVTATDISEKMLEAARSFLKEKGADNVDFKPADAESLPFDSDRFDLVTCRIASHHFPDCRGFLNECNRVLKTGGLMLLQDHFLPEGREFGEAVDGFERMRDPSHNRAYSKSEWHLLFETAGFEVLQVEEVIKHHQLYPWAKRQNCSREVIAQLIRFLQTADKTIQNWMQPQNLDTAEASFVNHQLLIMGQKKDK